MSMKEEIMRLREAVKVAGESSKVYKKWFRAEQSHRARSIEFTEPDPRVVDDPSQRATALCMAIAHSRGRIHAPNWTPSLEEQKKWLLTLLDGIARREEHMKKYNFVYKAALDEDERKLIRILIHETEKRQEATGPAAAVG